MNQKQIEELKMLAAKATPGPWVANTAGDGSLCEAKYPDGERHIIIEPAEWDDAAYIAAANPLAVIELIIEIERLEREAQWLAQALVDRGFLVSADDCSKAWSEAARKAVEESDAK